jgi:hypothetical protein
VAKFCLYRVLLFTHVSSVDMLESDAAAEDGGPGEDAIKVTQGDDGGIVIDNPLGNWSNIGSPALFHCDGAIELSNGNHDVSISVDYNSIFSDGAPVYRSVQLLSSASAELDETFGCDHDGLTVAYADCSDKFGSRGFKIGHSVSLKTYPRKTPLRLRSYPALSVTNHVFEILLEPELAVARISAWLDSMPRTSYEFCSVEVAWNCSHRDYYSQVLFDLNMYKLSSAGKQERGCVVELLRRGGDRFRANHLFSELRSLFSGENDMEVDNVHLVALSISYPSSADRMPEPDPCYISEDKIKQTILSALLDPSCDYCSKVEAIRLAGCIFTNCDGNCGNSSLIDREIVEAVASLRHSNVLFEWVAIPALAAVECH